MSPRRRFPRDEDVVFDHQFGEQLRAEVNLQRECRCKHHAELHKTLVVLQSSGIELPNLYCEELSKIPWLP
jgi:hypothetical protein